MSIASRINEIGVHLTKDWESIEALTGEAEVDKNIENIASVLDNLWEEMPKVTGTGESLTLNTKKGKMKVNLLGNTSQETTTGKNLLRPDSNLATSTMSGITFTPVYDNGELVRIDIKGTSNARAYYYLQSTVIEYGNIEGNLTLSTTGTGSGIYIQHDNYINETYQAGNTASGTVNATFNPNSLGYTQYRDYINIPYSSSTTYNTSVYPMLEKGTTATTYEPYTGGASPNSSYPQDVHIVSGDNTINVWGKNLVDFANKNQPMSTLGAYTILDFGKDETINSLTLSFIYDHIIYTNGTGALINYQKNDGTNQYRLAGSYGTAANVEYTGTYSKSETNLTFRKIIFYTYPNFTQGVLSIQVEKGTPTSYEPYQSTSYPIHLGEHWLGWIGDYKDRLIRTTGKNLLNANQFETFTTSIKYIELQLKPNTDYTFSSNIPTGTGDASNVFIINSTGTPSTDTNGVKPNSPRTITSLSDGIIKIGYRDNASSLTDEATKYWYMLNEGSTALPYEPYGTNEWYLEKKIGKVVLDGSENWFNDALSSTVYRFSTNTYTLNSIPYTYGKEDGYSDYFKYLMQYSGSLDVERIYTNANNITCITSVATTNNDFKNWLSTHNTIVYYVLATPTYTQITGTLKDELEAVWRANSYKGQTNISQVNNDLPFNLSVTALGSE